MKFKTTYSSYCPENTGTLLRTGAGEVHAILFTQPNAVSETVTLYDNTATSGNILIKFNLTLYSPVTVFFPPNFPLKFSTGLMVSTKTNTCGFVVIAY